MSNQLLWLETLLKGGIGLVMLALPLTAARLAGLPHGNSTFWPRMFGVALVGIAAAFAVEGYTQLNTNIGVRGIGLGGAIVVNVVTVLSLVGTLMFKGVNSRRGALLLWLLGVLLIPLILFEIAHA